MKQPNETIHTGSGADLAFAVVVLASYFTMFTNIKTISVGWLIAVIFLGIGYLAIGVYGYAYCAQHGSLGLKLAYFAIQILIGNLIIFLNGDIGFNAMILLPLAGHSVVLLPELWRYGVNAGVMVSFALSARLITGDWNAVWNTGPVFMAGQIFILVFTMMAVSEEKARHEIQEMANELSRANDRLRVYAVQAEELAITKERNRLAREIHDGLGHNLTAINMQVRAAQAVMEKNPQKAINFLQTSESLTQKALEDVRQSVAALRTAPEDALPLPEQVENVLKGLENAGVTGQLDVLGEPRRLSPQASLTIFRAVQESVNNTVKHARANRLIVVMDYREEQTMKLVVQDDGVGADHLDGGFGIIGMRERVQLLDGEFRLTTSKGNGFRIEIELPG